MALIADASDLINLLTDGAIADLDGFVSRLTGGSSGAPELIHCMKRPRVNGADATTVSASQWESLWRYDGAPMSHGAIPTTWENPDETWPGALRQTDETTAKKRIAHACVNGPVMGTVLIYDLLGQMAGLNPATSGTQNFNGGSDAGVTRYTDGVGNQIWVEIYANLTGGTIRDATIAYKNGGGSSKTTPAFGVGSTGLSEPGRIIKVPLAAGDDTVSAVVSINFSVALGGSGNFGVKIAHPIMAIPVGPSGMGEVVGFLNGPMPVIKPNACLAIAWHPKAAGLAKSDYLVSFIENA